MVRNDFFSEAMDRFTSLFVEAQKAYAGDPFTFHMATVGEDGQPSIRAMTLRAYDEQGFIFSTNTTSRKGRQMAGNPRVAMNFFWPPLLAQVKIEGLVEKAGDDETEETWRQRDRDSQIAFWASSQSEPLESRERLRQRFNEFKDRFRDQQVPRPETCSSYRVVPHRLEFWESGWHRLHEGLCFTKTDDGWERTLLNP